ncbi:MAG: hypothetical protein ABI833_00230 [Acidobacteriota bacterium]
MPSITHPDKSEAVLLVGSSLAPAGYAWVFPWGRHRVRVGVGIIHPDSDAKPDAYLDALISGAARYEVNLRGAQPLEHHSGLIPSECFARQFAGNGILGVGDAVGQASSLLGEGIRWAIQAGRMAGEVAAEAIAKDDLAGGSQRLRTRMGQTLWRQSAPSSQDQPEDRALGRSEVG